ncbi:hypothetical protein TR75_00770 [Hydrogenibacillus schlegelii]|uniref:Uncharacterized protein n=1 Tax=Hydrogenibacillus schlegelii TaxID=1484 RepID=A0A132NDZ9_HYDSH|nr:hypothetical protein TR75_00770 [Hydrogenibacillus schlegelii]OAR03219.1 hypothetical protein SA87_04840 [Hydrogenibacillus schlegelii]
MRAAASAAAFLRPLPEEGTGGIAGAFGRRSGGAFGTAPGPGAGRLKTAKRLPAVRRYTHRVTDAALPRPPAMETE